MDHTQAPSQRGRGRPRGPLYLQEMREELTAKNEWLLNPGGSYYEKRNYLNNESALHRRLRAYIRAGDRNLCAVCGITEERGARSWLVHFNSSMHQTNERQELVGMTCDKLVILATKPNFFFVLELYANHVFPVPAQHHMYTNESVLGVTPPPPPVLYHPMTVEALEDMSQIQTQTHEFGMNIITQHIVHYPRI